MKEKFLIVDNEDTLEELIKNGAKVISKFENSNKIIYIVSNTLKNKMNFNEMKGNIMPTNKLII